MRGFQRLESSRLDSTDPVYQAQLRTCTADFLRLWQHIRDEGIFSQNEELSDLTTFALEILPVPFYLGSLIQRRNDSGAAYVAASNSAAAGDFSSNSQQQQRGGSAPSVDQIRSVTDTRRSVLTVSNDFLMRFFLTLVDLKLLDERQVAVKTVSQADSLDRTAKVNAFRERKELTDRRDQLDNTITMNKLRAARIRRLEGDEEDDDPSGKRVATRSQRRRTEEAAAADDARDEDDDDGFDDENEELLRERHQLQVKLCAVEGFAIFQMNSRELQLLGSMSEQQKRTAIEAYQLELLSTATSLSSGASAGNPASAAYLNARSLFDGSSSASASNALSLYRFDHDNGCWVAPPGAAVSGGSTGGGPANYTILPGGHVIPMGVSSLRQAAYTEAFIQRNMPTQTLAEFAEGEIAKMQAGQLQAAAAQQQQKDEDERLGEDGIEERERQKQTKWDDWKDNNPVQGISKRGNLS